MIFAFFRMLKTNIVLVIVSIGGLLLAALKIQSARLGRAKESAKRHKASAERDRRYIKAAREHEAEFVSRSREIAKEIEETGHTKELTEKDPDW